MLLPVVGCSKNPTMPIHSSPYTHCTNQMLNARESNPTLQKALHSIVSTGLPHAPPSQLRQACEVAAAGAGTCTAGSPQVLWSHPTAICSFLASKKHRHNRSFSCTADQTQLWPWGAPHLFHRHTANGDTKTERSGRLSLRGFINHWGFRSHRETTSNTALLLLPTDPLNLLAWLELWKMRASPAFSRVSTDGGKAAMAIYYIVKYCWQKTARLDKGGSSLGYTFLLQTLQARDTKHAVLRHAPNTAIA